MSIDFSYHVPVRIIFGSSKINEAGVFAKALGTKALIVTTGTLFKENGLIEKLLIGYYD